MLLGKILADDADEIHGRETGCGDGAVGGGAAEEVFVFGELGFDVIQPNGSNDKNGHKPRTMGKRDAAIQKIIPRIFGSPDAEREGAIRRVGSSRCSGVLRRGRASGVGGWCRTRRRDSGCRRPRLRWRAPSLWRSVRWIVRLRAFGFVR